MNIVFLDVDGELTYSDYENSETANIDVEKIKLLKEICDNTNANVVITSSWRCDNNYTPHIYSVFIDLLKKNKIDVIGDAPHIDTEFEPSLSELSIESIIAGEWADRKIKYGTGRAAEVHKWISEHDVDNFVILDDEDFGWKDYGYDSHWVKPTWHGNGGLKREHVEQAINILRRST